MIRTNYDSAKDCGIAVYKCIISVKALSGLTSPLEKSTRSDRAPWGAIDSVSKLKIIGGRRGAHFFRFL